MGRLERAVEASGGTFQDPDHRTGIQGGKGVNSPESTYQITRKPDAFPMDRGWYRLPRGATGHGSDATACTPGRVVRLEVSRSAAWGSSWQASAGVRDEEKINRRSKLCALAPIMSYLHHIQQSDLVGCSDN